MRHHSGTHLLHKSLRLVLGDRAIQAGSLVAPHVARFDFPHEGPVETEQLEEVEYIINQEILADVPVVVDEMHLQQAIDLGAMAMFGEKYGDRVRVVSIDDFSRELCGGTHVARTGELGAAYIVGESGIGSGMRRVELVAGRAAYDYARERNRQIATLAEKLSSSPEPRFSSGSINGTLPPSPKKFAACWGKCFSLAMTPTNVPTFFPAERPAGSSSAS